MLLDDSAIVALADQALYDASQASFRTHSVPCPHCGVLVRYPIVARRQDVEDFALLMHAAQSAMIRFGITGNLVAELQSQVAIAIAKKESKR